MKNKNPFKRARSMIKIISGLFATSVLLLFACPTSAQEVISAGGNSFSNSTAKICFTVGETVVGTLTAGNQIITQGFQQSRLTILGIEDNPELNFSIQAFPNPVIQKLKLQIEGLDDAASMHYCLYDINGRLIALQNITGDETNIDFGGLEPAIYMICICKGNQVLKTIKVLKEKN